jgi:parallel beta-helix repeat protein
MGNKCNTKLFSSILIALVIYGGFLPFIGQYSRQFFPIVVYKDTYEENDTWDKNKHLDFTYPVSSQGELSAPILISSNTDLENLKLDGKITGAGTEDNPYILEDLVFDTDFSGTAIDVEDTNAYLIIRNCTVLNSGTSNPDSAIFIDRCSNIIIMNCILDNNEDAIFVGGFDNTVINNTILHTKSYAISISGHHNKILNNTFMYNDDYVISFDLSNSIIAGNVMTNNHGGMQAESSFSNYIFNNEVSGSSGGDGIKFYDSNDNNITMNTFLDGSAGISLWNSENTIISDNFISKTHDNGVQIFDSINTLIIDNNISDNEGYGILLENSPDSEIQNNNVSNSGSDNIFLMGSSDVLISENSVSYSDWGIGLIESDYVEISLNIILNNNWGIFLRSSNKNNITKNTITINANGIYLEESSRNNLIYFNDIYGNLESQAFEDQDCTRNEWDNDTIGNYWGNDYIINNPDATNDGTVWDTPFEIDGDGRGTDHIPLVNKFSDSDISELIEARVPEFPFALLVSLLVGIGLILGLIIKYRSNITKKIKEISSLSVYNDQLDEDKEKEKADELNKKDIVVELDKEEIVVELDKEEIVVELDKEEKVDKLDKEEIVDELDKKEIAESLKKLPKKLIQIDTQIDTFDKPVKKDVIPIKIPISEELLIHVPDPHRTVEKKKSSDIFNVAYIIFLIFLIILMLNI